MRITGKVKDTYRMVKGLLTKGSINSNLFSLGPGYRTPLVKQLDLVLTGGKITGLVYLDIVKFHEVHQLHGTVVASRVLSLLEDALKDNIKHYLPRADILAMENLWADDFIVLFNLTNGYTTEGLFEMAVALRLSLKNSLGQAYRQLTGQELELHVGYAVIEPSENLRAEIKLYMALRQAQEMAKGALDLYTGKRTSEFKELLATKSLNVVYQPITALDSGEILGWEALTRGPVNSYFHRPDVIFSFAEEAGLLYPTERLCRELAIRNLGQLGTDQKLFLNVHPHIIADRNFVKGETLARINEYGLNPQNIVFEITESHSIKDYKSFRSTLEHYRNQGYRVAVDDVGAGFSGLQSIAEIRPDYMKIDLSLVRNIDSNQIRRSVMEALLTLAEKISSFVIAEGVETQSELNTLLALGVHFVQGYYLARPAYPKPLVPKALVSYISRHGGRDINRGWRQPLTIEDIAMSAVVVDERTSVQEVKEKLDAAKLPISGVVVTREERPVGLVMRYNLYRVLSSQYGVSLYFQRPIGMIMDGAPLLVESSTPLEQAAEKAMNRESEKIYDDLIVIDDGALVGVVSVQRMLDSITRIQVELAKGANPLSGLPGNVAIEEELARRTCTDRQSMVIYADLDHFKAYNDTYGFESGDRMIVLLARIISHATKKYGSMEDFIGHIGGDDYIIISRSECAETICKSVVKLFDRLVRRCFSAKDGENGKFFGHNREGQSGWLPLVSVSLAVLHCRDKQSYLTLAERAAQLKKYAKALPGSVWVYDRRKTEDDCNIS